MKSYFNIFLISHLGSIFFIIINIMLALVQRQHYLDILVAFVLYYGGANKVMAFTADG